MSNALKNAIKRLLEVMIKEGVESVSIRRGWHNAGSTPEDYSVHVNFFTPAKGNRDDRIDILEDECNG